MSDLETRVARRRQELITELIVKDGLVGGWANVHPSAELKLVAWIAK